MKWNEQHIHHTTTRHLATNPRSHNDSLSQHNATKHSTAKHDMIQHSRFTSSYFFILPSLLWLWCYLLTPFLGKGPRWSVDYEQQIAVFIQTRICLFFVCLHSHTRIMDSSQIRISYLIMTFFCTWSSLALINFVRTAETKQDMTVQ